jgi:hypothetical protein
MYVRQRTALLLGSLSNVSVTPISQIRVSTALLLPSVGNEKAQTLGGIQLRTKFNQNLPNVSRVEACRQTDRQTETENSCSTYEIILYTSSEESIRL